MTEIQLAIIDKKTNRLLLDTEHTDLAGALAESLDMLPIEHGCARPVQILHPNPEYDQPLPHIRISGFWHDSLIEGPGRRSVVRMQGCPIRCTGCWVPQTHAMDGGYNVNIDWLAEALLDPAYERDGVTILGGEPFAQPLALFTLSTALWERGCNNVCVYTGYTIEALRHRVQIDKPNGEYIHAVLGSIQFLIDGRFIASQASTAGPWTGSGNQRVIILNV